MNGPVSSSRRSPSRSTRFCDTASRSPSSTQTPSVRASSTTISARHWSLDGLDGLVDLIDGLLKEIRPGTIVIDSFKAIRAFAADEAEFRRFLHDLAGRLTAVAANTFWIGEYERRATTDAAEFAVADSILAMDTKRTAERETRVIQILKLRGSGFMSGEHAYRVTASGISSSRGWQTSRTRPRTSSGPNAIQRASPRSMTRSETGTGRAPLRSSPDRPVSARHCWDCTMHSAPPPTDGPRSWRRSRRTRPSSRDRIWVRLVVRRSVHRRPEPIAGRPLHRRMGLRPARPHRGDQSHACRRRQPRRSARRLSRPGPFP